MKGSKLKRAQNRTMEHILPQSATSPSFRFKSIPSTYKAFNSPYAALTLVFNKLVSSRGPNLLRLYGSLVGTVLSSSLGGDSLLSVRVKEEADKEVTALR